MELDALQADPYYGAFVPHNLRSTSIDVQLFVVYLYREAQSTSRTTYARPTYWALLQDVAARFGPEALSSDQSMF